MMSTAHNFVISGFRRGTILMKGKKMFAIVYLAKRCATGSNFSVCMVLLVLEPPFEISKLQAYSDSILDSEGMELAFGMM